MAARKRKVEDKGDGSGSGSNGRKRTRTTRGNATSDFQVARRTTRSMTTDGPRCAVFSTAELLERIMMFLPQHTVFGAQRVCRQFRDIVVTSPKLQERLFLRPSNESRKLWITSQTVGNHALWSREHLARAQLFQVASVADIPSDAWKARDGQVPTFTVVALNPLFRHLKYHPTVLRLWNNDDESVVLALKCPLTSELQASWRNTNLTDPPCTQIRLSFKWCIRTQQKLFGSVFHTFSHSTGFKLGSVLENLLDMAGSEGHPLLWYDWSGCHRMQSGTLRDLLLQKEAETGKRAYVDGSFHISMKGVVVPPEEEKAAVKPVPRKEGVPTFEPAE